MRLLSFYILFLLPLGIISCNTANDEIVPQVNDEFSQMIDGFPLEPLSESEQSSLLFMREEEKLARDVYDYLYLKWSRPLFDNISSSEQSHMDAVLMLLNRYDLEDPAARKESGVFFNYDIQQLYDDLTQTGQQSIIEALKVGAAIEEIDILDLKNALEAFVDNQDIEAVYNNLMQGSENHLRSFVKNLANQGVTYQPQYLTQEEYDAIIN
ncbi:DUF2202 domain-containing protein [Marivirga harenae]|uniref:DUF2202 domain-containing protein n=1 Tax=Marivirga harenae TaxID=2010992 RepID=UPI0026DEAAEF|nr:DUF2202 domain-containing protein [Marivirga harenae]WKV11900.1 DUF2202 domain-containing protein [Marivirga harenae]|tara:strand:- start:98126 stop:98758 length:633 start_codon:yes stop_codon:yes gene_type:complete